MQRQAVDSLISEKGETGDKKSLKKASLSGSIYFSGKERG
jgi:hypothetical protein